MAEPLDPFGGAVTVGSITLRTPGLAGVAESYRPGIAGLRSPEMAAAEATTAALETALGNERFEPQETVVIEEAREVEVGSVATRSTSFGEPALIAEVPDPGQDWGQVLLLTDESGALSWSFAVDEAGGIDTLRGRVTRTYVIRRQVPPAPPEAVAATRSFSVAAGKKILKVLVFPILDPLIGEVGEFFVRRWEQKKRPYGVRRFGPDDFSTPGGTPLAGDDWRRLGEGRSLLFVHGTFSRAHSAFGGLSRETMAELHGRYEGRVFAFDHFTLSDDPKTNVEELLARIPDGARLDCDIVCHSRGGLVSRLLAEQAGAPKIRVGTIAFVAVPNHGTILSDPRYMGSFLDSYLNLLNLIGAAPGRDPGRGAGGGEAGGGRRARRSRRSAEHASRRRLPPGPQPADRGNPSLSRPGGELGAAGPGDQGFLEGSHRGCRLPEGRERPRRPHPRRLGCQRLRFLPHCRTARLRCRRGRDPRQFLLAREDAGEAVGVAGAVTAQLEAASIEK
jgi:hypothetical protein